MAQVIPLDTTFTAFDVETSLGGTVFKFFFKYNSRTDRWEFDLFDAADTLLIQGVKIVLNISLLGQYQNLSFPAGEIRAVQNEIAVNTDPGRNDFDDRVELLFLTDAEIAELQA